MVIELESTLVNCEERGHCPHEGTAVGSYYCCKCGQYLYSLSVSSPYAQFVEEQQRLIDAHPEWGVKYL